MTDENVVEQKEVKKERKIKNPIVLGLYYLFFGIFIALWKFLKWSYKGSVEGFKKYYPYWKGKAIAYKVWLFIEIKETYKPAGRMLKAIISMMVVFIFLWFTLFAPLFSPFVMNENLDIDNIQTYEGVGISTVNALQDPLKRITDGILMTNLYGVRFWNDNRYNLQTGKFETYKYIYQSIRDFLGRNRSSNGANEFLINGYYRIATDSNALFYPNYDFQISKAITFLDKYNFDLEDDRDKEPGDKTAVFIVNSDNLADVLRLLRKHLMTEADTQRGITFLNADDDYDRLRGVLAVLYQFLAGLEGDFADKMKEKGAYKDNYVPLMTFIRETIIKRPFFVTEWISHDVSNLRGKAQSIGTKMGELANRLSDG
jgi:hypothetical protein